MMFLNNFIAERKGTVFGGFLSFWRTRFSGCKGKQMAEGRKIVTRANMLTFSGIIAIGMRVLLFETGMYTAWIPILRIYTAFSDIFDGWLAERYNERSVLGRYLDPIRDRLDAVATLRNMWLLFGWSAYNFIGGVFLFEGTILLSGALLLLLKSKASEVHGIGKFRMAVHQIAPAIVEVQVYWVGYNQFQFAVFPLACMLVASEIALLSYLTVHWRELTK